MGRSFLRALLCGTAVLCVECMPTVGFAGAIEDNCGTAEALSTCVEPREEFLTPEWSNGRNRYEAASIRYFLTMKTDQSARATIATESDERFRDYMRPLESGEWNPINRWFRRTTIHPRYEPLVIRFEFPPWLLTTGYGAATMKNVDEALRTYRTDYKSIHCQFFPTQPFGRCHVVFLYGKDDPNTVQDERTECPIYEEFTFSDEGRMSFIEAWTDHDGYLPMDSWDYWAEADDVKRMSTYVPGLGSASGAIDPRSEAMWRAAEVFDSSFDAPYWSEDDHAVGPFTSMLDDINGTINGHSLPASDVVSFWPAWIQRSMAHVGGNVLNGCRPPDAMQP